MRFGKPMNFVVFMFLMSLFVSNKTSAASLYERESLRGIEGVYIIIDNFDDDFKQAGLSKQQIQSEVEGYLRSGGIRVLTKEESLKTPGSPALYININTSVGKSGLYACSIEAHLMQGVSLTRNSVQIPGASTWNTSMIGGGQRVSNFSLDIHDLTKKTVDNFIKDYLSVNTQSNPKNVR